MRILLRTALSPYTGYGNDGIGIARSLTKLGHDVFLEPTHVSPPLPRDVTDLLTRRLQAPFDLLIHHADPGALGISDEARRAATVTLAWTMWEYETLDNLKGRSTLKTRLGNYDAVVGYDTVTSSAFAPYLPRTAQALTVQGGFSPENWRRVQRDWTSPRLSFCMVGALHQRKAPFVAVHAFKELHDEYPDEFRHVELHLKTNTPGLHSAMQQWVPNLFIHYDTWPEEVLREFYTAQHVLIAPSKGEGKNVPALEFLATGGTVIATNWGGHTQWLNNDIGYPLDYELAAESADIPNCRSARASKEHLKQLMLRIVCHRAEAAQKGRTAADLIPQMCSWESALTRLVERLTRKVPAASRMAHDHRVTVANRPGIGAYA